MFDHTVSIDVFKAAPVFPRNKDVHLLASYAESTLPEGMVLEFGVFKGGNIRSLAAAHAPGIVWGFDSFTGLPEKWVVNPRGRVKRKGHFSIGGRLPQVPDNVQLVKGFFCDTLPEWYAEHAAPIAFLHMDADLYSSTIEVLDILNPSIVPGTVIVFDELHFFQNEGRYTEWRDGEWKAMTEWMEKYDRRIEVLSRASRWAATLRVVQ